MTIKFDAKYEKEILAASVRDLKALRRILRIASDHGFAGREADWLWTAIKSEYARTGELPDRALIMRKARSAFPDADKRLPYTQFIEDVYDTEPSNPETAIGELRRYINFHAAQTGMLEASSLMEKGDIEGALKRLSEIRDVGAGERERDEVWYIEEFEQRLAEGRDRIINPQNHIAIKTKIKALDEIITGLQAGEFGLIMAVTNMGKSIMANHMGLMAALQGYYVFHVVTEMRTSQVAMRYDSRLTRIDYQKFKRHDFTQAELDEIARLIDRRRERLSRRLHIYGLGARGGKLDMIADEIERRAEDGIPTNLIIIDSPDHLESARRYSDARHEITNVFWGVKDLAEKYNCAVWGTTQAGRDYEGKTATTKAIADDYNKARIADLVISINQTEEQKQIGEVSLFLAKYRDGEKGISIPLSTAFQVMMYEEIESAKASEADVV